MEFKNIYEHGPRCDQFLCFLNTRGICGKPSIIEDDIICIKGKINKKDYFFPEASIDVYSAGFNVIGTNSRYEISSYLGLRKNNMLIGKHYKR